MKKTIRKAVILIAVLCILCLSGCGRAERYAQAVSALEAGSYAAAAESFEALTDYADSAERAKAFALAAGAQNDDEGNCPWWTRSLGDHHGQICVVQADGWQNAYYSVGWDNICIRPAIWVNIHVQQE